MSEAMPQQAEGKRSLRRRLIGGGLALTSDNTHGFAMQGQSHAPIGFPARNTVLAASRLTVPLIRGRLGTKGSGR
jgi:hypothetical protein